MTRITPTQKQAYARVGLAGAVLSGVGDVLILGGSSSGRDFDHAAGVIPAHIDAPKRWRSLFNGVPVSRTRIYLGTLVGVVGIALLQHVGLRGIASTIPPGGPRRVAARSATAFALSGAVAHWCCGSVILAYKRATESVRQPYGGPRPAPRSATTLLAVSAAGSLTALAVLSGSLIVAAGRRESHATTSRVVMTPFPCVVATLLTFGVLPAPVGGWARPASMSIGLMVYFAVTAASAER